MDDPQLPGAPEWIDCDDPPPDSKVKLEPVPPPPDSRLIRLEGEHESNGQTFAVAVSAEREDEEVLEAYAESLYLVMEVGPDIPELLERLAAQPTARAGVNTEEGFATFEVEMDRAKHLYPDGVIIIVETEMISAGSSFEWAAKWSSLPADANEFWRGPTWVKMQVGAGRADLRGVKGGAKAVDGGGETVWEEGAGHCWVHGVQWSRYKLNAAWHR